MVIENIMRIICCIFLLSLWHTSLYARIVAECENSSGYVYYSAGGIVPDAKSGWQNDSISGGIVILEISENNGIDIIHKDATKTTLSAKEEGAQVYLIRITKTELTTLVRYPDNTIEIYSFMKESNGKNTLVNIMSRGGNNIINKNSMYVSSCSKLEL